MVRRDDSGTNRRTFEEQANEYTIVTGTPDTVVPKIRHVLETLRPGSVFFWDGDGAMTHEDQMRSLRLSPNPPKDTDGRREDSGRGVRELQGRWPGLHWGRWEVGGRSSVAAQGPYGRLRELRCAGWRENTQQGTLADRGGASLRGRWVSCRLAVRPGVEWLAAGPRRE